MHLPLRSCNELFSDHLKNTRTERCDLPRYQSQRGRMSKIVHTEHVGRINHEDGVSSLQDAVK